MYVYVLCSRLSVSYSTFIRQASMELQLRQTSGGSAVFQDSGNYRRWTLSTPTI